MIDFPDLSPEEREHRQLQGNPRKYHIWCGSHRFIWLLSPEGMAAERRAKGMSK